MQEDASASNWLPSQVRDTVVAITMAIVLAAAFRATVAQAYEIPSPSMEPTIMTGDRVIAEKLTLRFQAPVLGDVVVFDNPYGEATPFIKRVIALPGQTVDIKAGRIIIDGKMLAEPYTHGLPSQPDDDILMPFTIPDECIWVMGDNRIDSKDSRAYGPVPISAIRARALFIYWPPQHMDTLGDTN